MFSFSRKTPPIISKICMSIIFKTLSRIKHGHLLISLPDGQKKEFGKKSKTLTAEIEIKDYSFFNLLVFKSDIGLSDAYISEFWTTPNLENVFELFIKNSSQIKTSTRLTQVTRYALRLRHFFRRNSLGNAKKNIFEHYDLGNAFFKLFLDKHRVYSSAIFDTPEQTLEDAQMNKINHILELADVQPHHKILEIGSVGGLYSCCNNDWLSCYYGHYQ